ncbi:MAG TPA: sigma-70 family RNA polymerase sigma factor [Thermoanaerobaculia bacterium]|nr:sigma-70 family RNA polymerase sigma factor [Thermoanaerobaculia bacterium]
MNSDRSPSGENRIDAPNAGGGPLEARYLAFLETITQLRPSLHRYCSRMTGSVLDGEDVVQEALFQAYRKLDTFDDTRPLAPWLFRIAHNCSIDFLRRRGIRQEAESEVASAEEDSTPPVEPVGKALGKAVEHLVLALPPKERACVLLKDVFDYSLEEIAELVGSTVGGVKAALNRGRSKLAARPAAAAPARVGKHQDAEILQLYVDRFNEGDWAGLRELIAADAQLRVHDRFLGRLDRSPYFGMYQREHPPASWRMVIGEVDGEAAIVVLHAADEEWMPDYALRLHVVNGRIVRITDYWHCPWVIPAAASLVADQPA